MKKTIQLSTIVILVLAVAFSVFTVAGAATLPIQGTGCPNAGLNTQAASPALNASPLPSTPGCLLPPGITPMVGWNT